jgi:hypothetical protein
LRSKTSEVEKLFLILFWNLNRVQFLKPEKNLIYFPPPSIREVSFLTTFNNPNVRFFDDLMFKNSQETQRTEFLTKKDCVSVKKCKKTQKTHWRFAFQKCKTHCVFCVSVSEIV